MRKGLRPNFLKFIQTAIFPIGFYIPAGHEARLAIIFRLPISYGAASDSKILANFLRPINFVSIE